jgi:hypothetical protein
MSPAPTELALLEMGKSIYLANPKRLVTTTTGAHHEGEFNSRSTIDTQTNSYLNPPTRNSAIHS